MHTGDWSRLGDGAAHIPDLLRSNAERIRDMLAHGAPEPERLRQGLKAIENALAALDESAADHGKRCA